MSSCLRSALKKSCYFSISNGLASELQGVRKAAYQEHLTSSVIWSLLYKSNSSRETPTCVRPDRQAVVLYFNRTPHTLKKVGARYDGPVNFSYPNKVVRLINSIITSNCKRGHMGTCGTGHVTPSIPSAKAVVYRTPLSCERMYAGQKGRSLAAMT